MVWSPPRLRDESRDSPGVLIELIAKRFAQQLLFRALEADLSSSTSTAPIRGVSKTRTASIVKPLLRYSLVTMSEYDGVFLPKWVTESPAVG
jgi:hypothetical protein